MPYIKQEDRIGLDSNKFSPRNAGELNYAIHLLLEKFLSINEENYQAYNDMIGALEGAKLELYRRRISKYEDAKKNQNGDIEFYGL